MANRIEFTLNATQRAADIEEGMSLLEVLRDQCGVISPKDGCSPQGQCGCCTVIVDGRAVVSCAVPARNAAGKSVLTLEGFSELEREPVRQGSSSALRTFSTRTPIPPTIKSTAY